MKLLLANLATACLALTAWPILPAAAAQGQPAGIGFRNATNAPVIVQGASVVNGTLRRGQPILIPPGKVGWDNNLPAGKRFITIYDANQPTRVLYRDPPHGGQPFQGRDLFFGIRPVPREIRVHLAPEAPP